MFGDASTDFVDGAAEWLVDDDVAGVGVTRNGKVTGAEPVSALELSNVPLSPWSSVECMMPRPDAVGGEAFEGSCATSGWAGEVDTESINGDDGSGGIGGFSFATFAAQLWNV